MSGRSLMLEPFDRGHPLPDGAPPAGAVARSASMLHPFDRGAMAAPEPTGPAEAEHPPIPEPANETAETAPARDGPDPDLLRAQALERLATALETIAAGNDDIHARGMRAAAEGFARAAASALPSLVETGFAAEVAAASLDLAGAIKPRAVTLHLAPEDLEAVEAAVAFRDRDGRLIDLDIRYQPDPRVAPGEVALRWRGGGAEIEASTLTRLALESLDRAMARIGPVEPSGHVPATSAAPSAARAIGPTPEAAPATATSTRTAAPPAHAATPTAEPETP